MLGSLVFVQRLLRSLIVAAVVVAAELDSQMLDIVVILEAEGSGGHEVAFVAGVDNTFTYKDCQSMQEKNYIVFFFL